MKKKKESENIIDRADKKIITIPEGIVINPRPKRNDPIYRI